MTVIKAMREQLAADLAPLGVPVFASWPTEIVPPSAYVLPPLAGSYVTAGLTFREYLLWIDVVIIVGTDIASVAIGDLEALIELALINTVDWSLTGCEVPSPTVLVDGGAQYFGSAIHLQKPFRLD